MSESISSLSSLIQERMGLLGIKTQAELARRSKLTAQDINRFFSGGTKLPTADKRRKLAEALGIKHLDILVAAGEITYPEAGAKAEKKRDPNDPRERLLASIEGRPLTAQAVDIAIAVLDAHARTTSSSS